MSDNAGAEAFKMKRPADTSADQPLTRSRRVQASATDADIAHFIAAMEAKWTYWEARKVFAKPGSISSKEESTSSENNSTSSENKSTSSEDGSAANDHDDGGEPEWNNGDHLEMMPEEEYLVPVSPLGGSYEPWEFPGTTVDCLSPNVRGCQRRTGLAIG